jgi:hypothetical protein
MYRKLCEEWWGSKHIQLMDALEEGKIDGEEMAARLRDANSVTTLRNMSVQWCKKAMTHLREMEVCDNEGNPIQYIKKGS